MYLNENALIKINYYQTIEEGFIDAYRKQLEQDAKIIQAKKHAVYYTYKNGKLFFFFDRQALGIKDSISVWIKDIINSTLRFIFRVPKPELEFDIKPGADVHDVKHVLDYYTAHKNLDAIRYNKLCNTWSYLVMPLIKGPTYEKYYRRLIKRLNGVALPEAVLKDPSKLNTIINCNKKNSKNK